MHLSQLSLHNLRNIPSAEIELSPGFNYFCGANGAGKTAILEAVHVLARGRSFRTSKIQAVMSYGSEQFVVRGCVGNDVNGDDHKWLALSKSRSGQTEIRIAGQRESKSSALARRLPVQTLLPDAADLVFSGPSGRRGYLDWGLFHVEQLFLEQSSKYRRALAQRNAWLKVTESKDSMDVGRDPWLEILVHAGISLSTMRKAYLDGIRPILGTLLEKLDLGLSVELEYQWGGWIDTQQVWKKMSESFSRDVKFGVTHRGPHRADLHILADGHPAEIALSRGQGKLVASALILAQAMYLDSVKGTKSIILIDDFGAELDPDHWRFFLKALLELDCQVLATGTTPLHRPKSNGKAGVNPGEDVLESPVSAEDESLLTDVEGLTMFHVEHGTVNLT